jgi:AraC-like DNA-binding protein
LPGRLTIKGGFMVNGDRDRYLQKQARRLGFADLRGCLQGLLDDGWSVPQLATHLAATQAAIRHAITDHHLHQPPRRQQLARQRQHAAQQRAAARAAELGFGSVRAYLADRLVTKAWTLAAVAAELGAARGTLRRLQEEHQVRRVAPTRRQRAAAAAASGPSRRRGRSSSAARHAWRNSGLQRRRSTSRIGVLGGAGRCGGWAPNSGLGMAGWTSS